jgi:hypothetical protein
MAELAAVEVAHRLMELREQCQARRRDMDEDFATVGMAAAASDDAAGLKAIEETGNIGIAGDHARGDLAAQEAIGGAPQDAEHVVLIGRKAVFFEELGGAAGEPVGDARELDEDSLLRAGNEFAGMSGGAGHVVRMVVATNKCQ